MDEHFDVKTATISRLKKARKKLILNKLDTMNITNFRAIKSRIKSKFRDKSQLRVISSPLENKPVNVCR